MNWDVIASVAEVVSAAAVVVTLFYLSYQIRRSNVHARRLEENVTTDQVARLRMAIIQDKEIAELFLAGAASMNELDPADQMRFDNLMSEYFWTAEQMWDRVRVGTLEQEIWDNNISLYAGYICSVGGVAWWLLRKETFPKEFVLEVDAARPRGDV
jgi:hypothetical protein